MSALPRKRTSRIALKCRTSAIRLGEDILRNSAGKQTIVELTEAHYVTRGSQSVPPAVHSLSHLVWNWPFPKNAGIVFHATAPSQFYGNVRANSKSALMECSLPQQPKYSRGPYWLWAACPTDIRHMAVRQRPIIQRHASQLNCLLPKQCQQQINNSDA